MEREEIIEKLYLILEELDARETSCNCVVVGLISKSWVELCDNAIELFKQLKEAE